MATILRARWIKFKKFNFIPARGSLTFGMFYIKPNFRELHFVQ